MTYAYNKHFNKIKNINLACVGISPLLWLIYVFSTNVLKRQKSTNAIVSESPRALC